MTSGGDSERQLQGMFIYNARSAIRFPGSGSHPFFDLPDVLGKLSDGKELAIENKYTSGDYAKFSRQDVKQLVDFSDVWGAEALLTSNFSYHPYEYQYMTPKEALEEMDRRDIKSVSISRDAINDYPQIREFFDGEFRRPDKTDRSQI